MASIGKRTGKKGETTRMVQFFSSDGERRTIGLGGCTAKQAAEFRSHVEHLLTAAAMGIQPDQQTAQYVGRLSDELHRRLADAALVKPREDAGATELGPFIDGWIE